MNLVLLRTDEIVWTRGIGMAVVELCIVGSFGAVFPSGCCPSCQECARANRGILLRNAAGAVLPWEGPVVPIELCRLRGDLTSWAS